MFGLIKKDYEITLFEGKTAIFKQLSYYECLEFVNMITKKDFNLVDFVYDLLKNQIAIDYEDLQKIDYEKFLNFYKNYCCKGFFSEKTNINKNNVATFESYLTFLSKEINLDPLSILKNYTPEQLEIITDGVIFNLNEQTKEGQKANKIKAMQKQVKGDKEQNKKDLEFIKAQREKRLKLNKK